MKKIAILITVFFAVILVGCNLQPIQVQRIKNQGSIEGQIVAHSATMFLIDTSGDGKPDLCMAPDNFRGRVPTGSIKLLGYDNHYFLDGDSYSLVSRVNKKNCCPGTVVGVRTASPVEYKKSIIYINTAQDSRIVPTVRYTGPLDEHIQEGDKIFVLTFNGKVKYFKG